MSRKILMLICLFAFVAIASAAPVERQKRGSLSDEADRIMKQAGPVDINNVGQLIDLTEKYRADGCLARVICELSNNPRAHGEPGNKFAQSLLRFRQSKHPKVKHYLDAMTTGVRAKNSNQCAVSYPGCNHSTSEVVTVGNKLLGSR